MKPKQYRNYSKDPMTLKEAEKACLESMGVKPQHTPTPWHSVDGWSILDKNGRTIAETRVMGRCYKDGSPLESDLANTTYIVKAVNCHEELLGFLKGALVTIKAMSSDNDTHFIKEIERVITKAEGQNVKP